MVWVFILARGVVSEKPLLPSFDAQCRCLHLRKSRAGPISVSVRPRKPSRSVAPDRRSSYRVLFLMVFVDCFKKTNIRATTEASASAASEPRVLPSFLYRVSPTATASDDGVWLIFCYRVSRCVGYRVSRTPAMAMELETG